MKYFVLLLIPIVINGCQAQIENHLKKDEKEIVVKIIDKLSYVQPPPPPNTNDAIYGISDTMVDSIGRMKLKVAIYPIMGNEMEKSSIDKIPNEYQDLLKPEMEILHLENVKGLESKKGHTIMLADTQQLKKSMEFKNFDLLYNFSRIRFDENYTKAIFEVGVSRSRLAGNASIFCLKKVEGNWNIEHVIPTSEW
ncbi:hypothetical protein [Flagellimonas lutaonensis]|uniref:Uncharacterized protein n=1 Tax=Flagellimonas lutaonensis TaxID=516051 RepID=A0A0D5YW75_9FLAO|nr:hypothetical protein [Allomuricauda lutaonensis]AKA36537.1 hypothetical protein VC82_2993 [Allomuricauda lutaonensis]